MLSHSLGYCFLKDKILLENEIQVILYCTVNHCLACKNSWNHHHTIKKLHSRCQHLHRHCTKLRTMCGNYSESARNFAFFSEKSCPAVITVATNITSGLDIMSYVSKDVRLGYEIGKLWGESRNLNIIIQSWQVAVAWASFKMQWYPFHLFTFLSF